MGNLYIADRHNDRIRKVDAAGVISTVAGTGERGYSGDGGPGTAAWLHYPSDVAVPAEDVLYAGASPCCAGLYQFTLRLPDDLPDGGAPIVAAVNGVSTPRGPFLTVRRRQ